MDKEQENFINEQAKQFAKIVYHGTSKYDQLTTLQERLEKELSPFSESNKTFFLNAWKSELDLLFKDHFRRCPDPATCPQHKTSKNASFLVTQFNSTPEEILEIDDKNLLEAFSDNNNLDYYFNASNIPNQKLVLDTYTYFEKGDGKKFFNTLDFLNLLHWHYRFLKNNVDAPFFVLNQFMHLWLNEQERHILYAFILKWFGGYPINNLNAQFNTTLKLIEIEYLEYINKITSERQYIINKLLEKKQLTSEETAEEKKLQKEKIFIENLDKIISNKEQQRKLEKLESATKNILLETPKNNDFEITKSLKYFISHSSKDEELVKLFTDKILRLALDINLENIFCTSIEACSIATGEDFRLFIKKTLHTTTHVVQIITENYKSSEVCLNEMGAAWALEKKVYPFILNPIQYETVGFIHQPNQLLKLDEIDDILHFIDELKPASKILHLTEIKRHAEEFIKQVKNKFF